MKKLLIIILAAILLTSCSAIKQMGKNMNSNYTHKADKAVKPAAALAIK